MAKADPESESPDFGGIVPIPVPNREAVMPDIIGKSLAVRIMIGLCWLYSKLPCGARVRYPVSGNALGETGEKMMTDEVEIILANRESQSVVA